MRIILCDDQPEITADLQLKIENYFRENHQTMPEIVAFHSGDLVLADKGYKDIAFLDVEMPGKGGIEVAAQLKEENPNVVIMIVTTHKGYLPDAMDLHVFRFIEKPIDTAQLNRYLGEAVRRYYTTAKGIDVDTGDAVVKIALAKVLYFEAHRRGSAVHTLEGVYETKSPFEHWRQVVAKEATFYESHRGIVVNMKHVVGFDHSQIFVGPTKESVYLSRRKYKEFKDAYMLYRASFGMN